MNKDNISKLIEQKDFQTAKAIIINESDNLQDDLELQKYLGLCNLNLGCIDEAQNVFEKIKNDFPDDVISLFYLSLIYIEKSKYDEAEELLNKVIFLRSEYLDAYKSLCVCYISTKQINKILDMKDKMISINPEDAKIYDFLSVAYLEQKDYEQAIEMIKKANELEPEKYTYSLACAYDLGEKYEEACKIIEKLLSFDLNNYRLKIHLASLYSRRSMFESAKILYMDIIKSGVVSRQLLYEYALICAKCNDLDTAEEILKKILSLFPDFGPAYKDLGVIYLSRKFFDRALDNFKKAFELAPEDENIIFEYGNYYFVMAEFENAKNMYNKLLEKENIPVNMLHRIALNYMSMNDVDKAKEILLKAIKTEPQNPNILYSLAQIYYFEKNYENAKQLLEDTYMYSPNKDVSNLLAKTYMELGQYNEAYALFNIVYLSVVNNVDVLFNLAKCKYRQGDLNKAKEHLNDLLKILPEHEEAKELLKLINEKDEQ